MSGEYAGCNTQNFTKAGKDLTLNYEIDNGLHYEGLDYMQGSLEFLVEHNESMVPAGQASLMLPRDLIIGPELPANQQATYLAVYQAVDTIKRLGSFANKPNIRDKVFDLVKDTTGIPLSIDDYAIIERHKDAEKEARNCPTVFEGTHPDRILSAVNACRKKTCLLPICRYLPRGK